MFYVLHLFLYLTFGAKKESEKEAKSSTTKNAAHRLQWRTNLMLYFHFYFIYLSYFLDFISDLCSTKESEKEAESSKIAARRQCSTNLMLLEILWVFDKYLPPCFPELESNKNMREIIRRHLFQMRLPALILIEDLFNILLSYLNPIANR